MRVETSPEDIHGMHAAARHPHRARRHDQPRRRGRARHGPAVRVRRRRAAHRRQGRHHDASPAQTFRKGDVITIDGCKGEVLDGPREDAPSRSCRATSPQLMSWADAARTLSVRANADTPRDARQAARVRRRGHRPVPHRAHVLRGEPHPRHARDDLRRRRGAAAARRWPRSCRCSAPTSWSCSRSWPACRSPSACSTRRCTSSCRTRRRRSTAVAKALGRAAREAAGAASRELHEFNPMLGLRGCRLGIAIPRSPRCRRAPSSRPPSSAAKKTGKPVVPEVMIPLVA